MDKLLLLCLVHILQLFNFSQINFFILRVSIRNFLGGLGVKFQRKQTLKRLNPVPTGFRLMEPINPIAAK